MCWYWKINRIIELLEAIAAKSPNHSNIQNNPYESKSLSDI